MWTTREQITQVLPAFFFFQGWGVRWLFFFFLSSLFVHFFYSYHSPEDEGKNNFNSISVSFFPFLSFFLGRSYNSQVRRHKRKVAQRPAHKKKKKKKKKLVRFCLQCPFRKLIGDGGKDLGFCKSSKKSLVCFLKEVQRFVFAFHATLLRFYLVRICRVVEWSKWKCIMVTYSYILAFGLDVGGVLGIMQIKQYNFALDWNKVLTKSASTCL